MVPVVRVHLLHDAANVILYRKLREIQICGDFLVRHSSSHQADELELPAGQRWPKGVALIHLPRTGSRFTGKVLGKAPPQTPRPTHLPPNSTPPRFYILPRT